MRTLVVPDLHHALGWLDRVLDRELARADAVVFLGDYFDAPRPAAGTREVCHRLADLDRAARTGDGPPCTFLVGNHDLPYVALWRTHRRRPTRIPHRSDDAPFGGPGYSRPRALDVCRYAHADWLRALRLVATVPGPPGAPDWLLSHAGVPADLAKAAGPSRRPLSEALGDLRARADRAFHGAHLDHDLPWFWRGADRDGPHARSGPLWQDWDRAFHDDLPWPQLVGHTPAPGRARRRGRSWCLDGAQTTYATIEDGVLSVAQA